MTRPENCQSSAGISELRVDPTRALTTPTVRNAWWGVASSGAAHAAVFVAVHVAGFSLFPESFRTRPGTSAVVLELTPSCAVSSAPEATIVPSAADEEKALEKENGVDVSWSETTVEIDRNDTEPLSRLPPRNAPRDARAASAAPREMAQTADAPQVTSEMAVIPRSSTAITTPATSSPTSAVIDPGEIEQTLPQSIYNPNPVFPSEAIAAARSGVVMLRIAIGIDGSVTEIAVHQTSGLAAFDQAALDAVSKWRFAPARQWGMPVPSVILKPIRFDFQGSTNGSN